MRHVIVCGHYGCSGVHAALTGQKVGLADNWLRHVQDVRESHAPELDAIGDPRGARTAPVRTERHRAGAARLRGDRGAGRLGRAAGRSSVHGWIYGLEDGLLHDLAARARCAR